MNPFKSFCLTWWQAGLFKVAVLSVGLAVGANWPHTVAPLTRTLVGLAIVAGGYVTVVWLGQ